MSWSDLKRVRGIRAALASAFFLGFAPIFGKLSILSGFSWMAVVALRTGIASLLLVALMLLFQRQFFYIYPVGVVGCLLAGLANGIGSLFYYNALGRIDASVGQLLYSFYPLFVALWLVVDRQRVSKLTLVRLTLSIPAVYLLIRTAHEPVDLVGAGMMLVAALFYALHLLINQRVLYDIPSPTVTLYTLLAMSLVVIPAYLLFDRQLPGPATPWWPVVALALITFLSRLTLFMGVKHIGGMQTALLGLGELIVTMILAQWWLGEKLSPLQWVGAALLGGSLLLVGFDKGGPEKRHTRGLLSWLHPPELHPEIHWQSHD